ncbi:MAG: PP2C family serine/threonine-protein phosphatase [Chloroflexota bacterium]
MTLDIGTFTSLGMIREQNTDLTDQFVKDSFDNIGGKLFILADGSGRSDYAEIATRLAIRYISRTYYALLKRDPDMSTKDALVQAFQQANTQIYDKAYQLLSLGQMGAAVVAAVLRDDMLTVVWHGNARLYFLPFERKSGVKVTEDHTVYEVEQEDGSIATVLPLLGTSPDPAIGLRTLEMRGGDAFVLCSDGIHSVMRPDDFTEITRNRMSVQMATRDLATEAARRGSQDNASAILVRLSSDEVAENEYWSSSYNEINKLIADLDLISDAEQTKEVPQQVIDEVVAAAKSTSQPNIEDVLKAIDEAMPVDEEDTAKLTPGQLDRAAAEEMEAGVPQTGPLNEKVYREVSVDDLDPDAIASFELPDLDGTGQLNSETIAPVRQFQENVTMDGDDDIADYEDADEDWIDSPVDFLFDLQPPQKPAPDPDLIAGLEPPDEFIPVENESNSFRFAPELDPVEVTFDDPVPASQPAPAKPEPQSFGVDDFLSSLENVDPEPAFLQADDSNQVDFDDLDNLLDAALAATEEYTVSRNEARTVTLPDSFYDEDPAGAAFVPPDDDIDIQTFGDDLINQSLQEGNTGNNRIVRFAMVFAAVLLSIAFTVMVATFLASSLRESDIPPTIVALQSTGGDDTASGDDTDDDTFNKAIIAQEQATARPTVTEAPTLFPTAVPTEVNRAAEVPNGWAEGTILYITTQTGLRRDVFSPPLEEDRFQYNVGDSVRVSLARQAIGYREWYEFDGERWWFVNGIGWLNENELSDTPPG